MKNFDRMYGIAVDVGTSTVCASILDLKNKKNILSTILQNKQSAIGYDIISRMEFATKSKDNANLLHQKITETINDAIEYLLAKANIQDSEVNKISFSGNTAMYHFLLKEDIYPLSRIPFKPKRKNFDNILPQDINLKLCNKAKIYFLPIISGYLGGDTTSLILTSKIYNSKKVKLLVDLGTNGEIVLGNKDKILATSVACGPAFESGNISCGTIAKDGAIQKVIIKKNVEIETIGNCKPHGLCGSGLISLISQMLGLNLIDKTGRLKGNKFTIYKDKSREIFITQNDIRNFQFAKSAVLSGIEMLKDIFYIKNKDIDEIQIAGAFGNYIDVNDIVNVGILPDIGCQKIKFVGNSSLKGAEEILLYPKKINIAKRIIKNISRIQLGGNKLFQARFIENLNFKEAI